MRRVSGQFWLVFAIFVLLTVAALYGFSSSPDAYGSSTAVASSVAEQTAEVEQTLDERVAALETEVAALQTQVAQSPGSIAIDKPRESSNQPPTHDITVTIALYGYDNIVGTGSLCMGTGGFDDMGFGTSITVMDQAGVVIGTGMIETTTRHNETCTLSGVVRDVPEVSFYQFKISHRGAPSYSLQEMKDANWVVELSLGT